MAAQQQSLETLLGSNSQRKSLKQQLDDASVNVEPGRATLADLPGVRIGCKRYIPEEYIANKNRKGRRSWIQAHGFFLIEISSDSRTLQTYWVCSKCDEQGKSSLFVASNTTSPIEHLRRSHMITQTNHPSGDADEDTSCADIHPPSKRRCLELPTARSNVNKAKELTVGWIVTANLPFTAPSNPYLRRILELHDASLAKEVPWNRQSVRDTMRKLFEVKKRAVSSQLEKAVTKISFSFDMWTSPNRYAFLGLHAHYLDASYQVQSRLLALRRVWGSHSGDNQASTIYNIFGEYGIRDRIGAGVCDNVSSNDTCLASLYRQLSPVMTEEDASNHRTRCFGHIINLAARAFLWGKDPDSFEREAFTEAAFQVKEPRSTPRAGQGRGRERHLPQHTRDAYTGASSKAERLDDHRRCIQISINNCWSKLDEYYSLLGQSPLYTAAVILHPRWNVSWLEANWTSREQLVWLRDAKNSVRAFFDQHYPPGERSDPARTAMGKVMRQDEPSQFDQWMQSYDHYAMEEDDELGAYMRQGPVRRENLNPILWWRDHREEYPRLSQFALDILAVPAMSGDPERTFSVTKLTVSSQRHSLSPEIIEEIQCLRNWLGHQAITVGEVVSFGGELIGWDEEEV
ncbi:pol-like protein [Hirsutella rhossiliensis]|uniref:Pol-like protein n=1 Tax=Hirsutella rhossiliensis TaxID=111463 RepID=A0A9P8MZI9_9HYPO|nr:pol-like protein [Hirsutella rhossiliensis]KAH0961992.1 pol-like protein [Hirsutella rhossiliensis]